MKVRGSTPKKLLLVLFVAIYIAAGVGAYFMVQNGDIDRLEIPPSENPPLLADPETEDEVLNSLNSAINYLKDELIREDGFVTLYNVLGANYTDPTADNTNSEALSYALEWSAYAGDKETFDQVLNYTQEYSLHPTLNYMRWRLTPENTFEGDGINSATDAELRAIRALLIAEQRWGDDEYTIMIDKLAEALEKIGFTDDNLLAPYAGPSGEDSYWNADEVWLSYADFNAFRALADRRGEPWETMYDNMKQAYLDAQIWNGLYNSELTVDRRQGNGPDGGGYSINSMWMMVRAAESDDPQLEESARRSLAFYKDKYERTNELFAQYDSSGEPISPTDTPWVYALVGRAASEIPGEQEFADTMIEKLLEKQVDSETSSLYGSFPEGGTKDLRVGQFTLQESILTLQVYLDSRDRYPPMDEMDETSPIDLNEY